MWSSASPSSTLPIEELLKELGRRYTITIVTHNMQQAGRVSDFMAFFNTEVDEEGFRYGRLVEFDRTEKIFNSPANRETEEYVSGCFG